MLDLYVAQADLILDKLEANEPTVCEELYEFIRRPAMDYEIKGVMIQIFVKECYHGKVPDGVGSSGRVQD